MDYNKKICEYEWCKKHSQCVYRNAISILKSEAYIVALDNKECADRILCYENSPIVNESVVKEDKPREFEVKEKLINIKINASKCHNPKCWNKADLRYSDVITLCNSCLDKLRRWKSNHELAKHFNSKEKILKLLAFIENEERDTINDKMIRCANIYCGTTEDITRHHLVPKPYRRGICTPAEKIPLCRPCHDRVHQLKTNRELAKNYNTKEAVVELLGSDREFRITRFIGSANEEYQAMMA